MGWNLSNASYINVSFSVNNEDSIPIAVAFKSDGSKFYMMGWATDTIYQYSLSTDWDISTASYDNVSSSIGSIENAPVAMFFKADGSKVYISGQHFTIYQCVLSTPWDISTISYDNKSLDVSGQNWNPYGIHFKSDGAKMYIINQDDSGDARVYQYSLSSPWNVSTASYDNVNFDISSQGSGAWYYDIHFNSDGTKFYVVDDDGYVYQYLLSTAWNISTASYDVSFNVSDQDGYMSGIDFNSDGTKMYLIGQFSDAVHQYSLPDIILTTLAPNLVEDGIANLKLNLEDMAGLTIDSVGYYCDENAAPSTEYIETGWRAEIETGIYNIYVKTLPAGQTTLYVQAWADDSDGNRYTGSILSFDIPTEAEYTELPDIIFPELPEIPAIEIDLPDINYDIGLDLYLDRTYTRKDLEELKQKCINYEKNYTDFCLILNHNTLLVKNFLQSAYNNGVLGGENEMFTEIYPSQQLTPLYLEPLEPNDFKGIINRFINNNTSNSMGLNHNFDLFKEWLNDYNYTSDGYKASYITPREKMITNNEPTVKYLTGKINRLQREVSMASREITHNFNLMKEIIQ